MEPTLSQALHLLNGDTVNAKIQQGGVVNEADRVEEVPRGADHRPLHPLPLAASRPDEELDKLLPDARRGVQPGAGPRGHLLGPAQQPRVPVQPLIGPCD